MSEFFGRPGAPPSAEPVLKTAALLLEPPSAGSSKRRVEAVSNGELFSYVHAGAHAPPVSDVETLVDFSMKSAIADLR